MSNGTVFMILIIFSWQQNGFVALKGLLGGGQAELCAPPPLL